MITFNIQKMHLIELVASISECHVSGRKGPFQITGVVTVYILGAVVSNTLIQYLCHCTIDMTLFLG